MMTSACAPVPVLVLPLPSATASHLRFRVESLSSALRRRAETYKAPRLCRSTMFITRSMICAICFLNVNAVVALDATRERRRTVDGRLCAASFVQTGTAYTGCTDAIDPNGVSGRPWCYVEAQLTVDQDPAWGFCAPASDYDAARKQAHEEIAAKTQAAQRYISKLHKAEAAAKDTLTTLRSRCG